MKYRMTNIFSYNSDTILLFYIYCFIYCFINSAELIGFRKTSFGFLPIESLISFILFNVYVVVNIILLSSKLFRFFLATSKPEISLRCIYYHYVIVIVLSILLEYITCKHLFHFLQYSHQIYYSHVAL